MFKVGDIVTGLTEKQYAITNSLGTYEVVEVQDNYRIRVRVITHVKSEYIGKEYSVDTKKFQWVGTYDLQAAVLKKIAHLRNLFENRKQEYKPHGL